MNSLSTIKFINKYLVPPPVSPMLANFVLEDLEETVLGKGKYTTPFYFRYVDDVITALNEDDINSFLEDKNSYHRILKFTKNN